MKIRIVVLACASQLAGLSLSTAVPAVEFDTLAITSSNLSVNGFVSGTNTVPFSETQLRNPAGGSYNSGQHPAGYFYGGAITDQSPGITAYTVQKTGGVWPSNNWFYIQAGGAGSGVLNKSVSMLTLWQQADFDNELDRGLVRLGDGTAVLSVLHRPGHSGVTNTLRLVIKRGDTYFVSGIFSTGAGTVVTTGTVANLSSLNWYFYFPSLNVDTIGAAANLTSFENIQALGILAKSTMTNSSFTNPPRIEVGKITLRGVLVEPKPVLLIGPLYRSGTSGTAAYGAYEADAWVNEVLLPNRIDFRQSQLWVDPSEWPNYSAVVLANGTGLVSNPSGTSAIASYVSGGGTLVLVESALSQLNANATTIDAALQPIIGASTRGTAPSAPDNRGTAVYDGEDNIHPWPADVAAAFTTPVFPTSNDGLSAGRNFHALLSLTTAQPILVSSSGRTLMAVNQYGTGQSVFLGNMLFRLYGSGSSQFGQNSLPIYANAISKMMVNLGASDIHNINLPAVRSDTGATGNFVAWRGDPEVDTAVYAWDGIGYAPRFSPLWPSGGEKLATTGTAVRVDMGRNEIYSVPLNVFAFEDIDNLEVSMAPAGGSPAIPSGGVKLYVQKEYHPEADPNNVTGSDQQRYWLRPVGTGTNGTAIPYGENGVFWLKFDSKKWTHSGTVPAVYAMNLTLSDGTSSSSHLISLKIHPVTISGTSGLTISGTNAYHLGFYDYYTMNQSVLKWMTLTGPATYTDQTYYFSGSAPLADPVLDAGRDIGTLTVNGTSMDINTVKLTYSGTVMTLKTFIDKRKLDPSMSIFSSGTTVRPLDFSGYNARVAAALNRGASRVQFRTSLMTGTTGATAANNLATNLTGVSYGPGEAPAVALSGTWATVNTQIWSQFKAYLSSGTNSLAPSGTNSFKEFYFKYGDELGASTIVENWLPFSETIAAAGWKPEVNLTHITTMTPELFNDIKHVLGVLQINENFVDYWQSDVLPLVTLPPGLVIKSYGSWGYFKSPSSYVRSQWWELWSKNFLMGLDYYSMGLSSLVAAEGGDRVFYFNPGLEGLRNGWHDAAYLKLLRERHAAASPSAWKTNVASFFANWIAPDADTAMSGPYWHGAYWANDEMVSGMPNDRTNVKATTEQLERSRQDVLELLSSEP